MSKESEIADYLNDIVAAITEIEEFTSGMNYDAFAADKKTVNAVIRSLEVLGEATKHVPAAVRRKNPDIPWKNMAALRDVLIHKYMGVDLMTVWKVVQDRLPELKPLVEKLLP